MDVDGNDLIYAVDDQGICHLLTIEETIESIVHLSNQIDHSLQLNNEDFIQNSSKFFSTQPFTIIDLAFNNESPTPVLTSPLQFSGHIASQYLNVNVINSVEKKMKKRKHQFQSRFDRLNLLKKQIKSYMKKKKKHKPSSRSNVQSIEMSSVDQPSESSLAEVSTMMDFQFIPDLSKRKYIYKDITLSNQNQMNWRIFQCTQQPSGISHLDSTNDHPFLCVNNPNSIALPDRRIGLSRHHSIKQLHKMISDL